MRELPTRQIDLLRSGARDLEALRTAMRKLVAALEPYQKKKS
jgi:hypothetical protein